MADTEFSKAGIVDLEEGYEKLIGMDLLRASEAAALNVFKWIGKGHKEAADDAATDAIRGMINLMDISGTCLIGEGIKDEAPGIFVGEKLGTWREGSSPVSIAVDPIDGTTLTSKGLPGALTVIAAAKGSSSDEQAVSAIPSFYVDKIAVGPGVRDSGARVRIDAPVEQNLEIVALTLGKRVNDLVVCILDRPRHEKLIRDVRNTGAIIRLIGDGDVAAAIAPCMASSIVDVYMGKGGSPEAVLAAAAIKCLGGDMQCKIWPRDDEEQQRLEADGHADLLDKVFTIDDMIPTEDVVFVATGVTDNALLHGVTINKRIATTYSVIMRAHSRTVRYVKAFHDLDRKTIRLASKGGHVRL